MQKQLLLSLTLVSSLSLSASEVLEQLQAAKAQAELEEITGLYRRDLTDPSAPAGYNLHNAAKAARICRHTKDLTRLFKVDAAGTAVKSDGIRVTLEEIEDARLEAALQAFIAGMQNNEAHVQTCIAFMAFLDAQEALAHE